MVGLRHDAAAFGGMSIQAINWVLEHSQSRGSARLVMVSIANHASPEGVAWPGYNTIASEANCDRSTAIRAVEELEKKLEEVTVLRPGPGRGRSNTYIIRGLKGGTTPPLDAAEKVASRTEKVASRHEKGRRMRPEPSLTVNNPAGEVRHPPGGSLAEELRHVHFSPGTGVIREWS
jgi:Helix-turn-helix domain